MKKIVRLTESDLVKLVKRVIKEQQTGASPCLNELANWAVSDGGASTTQPVIAACSVFEANIKKNPTIVYDNQEKLEGDKVAKACLISVYGEGAIVTKFYKNAVNRVLGFATCVKTGSTKQM
jgi:hypothetical protein